MHSTFAKLALLASSLSFAACAVQQGELDADPTGAAEAEITKFTAKYLGTWNFDGTATDTVKFYDQLTLMKGSAYRAVRSPVCKPGSFCPAYLLVETGKWSVSPKGELMLKSDAGTKALYTSSVSSDGFGLKLFNASGHEYLTRLARAGEHCGGFVVHPRECEEGLVCFLSPIPDVGGTCAKPAGAGESCGFRTQSKPCADGLECVHVSGPRDALTCAKPKPAFCGGIAGIECPPGYACILDGTYPDAGGHCEVCVVIDCAAPPPGCHYESDGSTGCRKTCGKLVCDGGSL